MIKKDKIKGVLVKIKKDEIKPISKWHCRLVNWSFWLATTVAVVLSSVFFSVILINLFEIPIETIHHLQWGRYLRLIFEIFPFVWFILVVVSLVLSLVAFNKTKYGYRYNFILLVSGFLTIIFASGFVFHGLKINKPLREFSENRMPRAFKKGPFDKTQNAIFIEEGLLGGEIIEKGENKIFIKNLVDEKWQVDFDDETKIKRNVKFDLGDQVIVVGEKRGKFLFQAFVIKNIENCPNSRMPKASLR